MQKLSWMTLPLQIQKRKNYLALSSMTNWSSNITLRTCARSALSRVVPFVNLPQKKVLFNAFFQLQFSYFPLVWMCHSRTLNNKINSLHERCLRLIYNNKHSTFHQLLEKDCSVSIHTRNLQFLVTEMYKLAKGISPTIMQEIFRFRNSSRYNLRSQNTFEIPFRNHVYNGTESISYLGPKVWELVPDNLKRINSLTSFKEQIKKWNPENCPCRLCKTYIQHVGFINWHGLLL